MDLGSFKKWAMDAPARRKQFTDMLFRGRHAPTQQQTAAGTRYQSPETLKKIEEAKKKAQAEYDRPAPYGYTAPDERAFAVNDARPKEGFITDPALPQYQENVQTPGYDGVQSPQFMHNLQNERRAADNSPMPVDQETGLQDHFDATNRKFGNEYYNEPGTSPKPIAQGRLPVFTPSEDPLSGGGSGVDGLDLGALGIPAPKPAQSPQPGNVTGNPYQNLLDKPWSDEGATADPQSVVQNNSLPGQAGGADAFNARVNALKQQNAGALKQKQEQPQVMAGRPPIAPPVQQQQPPLGMPVAPENQEDWEKKKNQPVVQGPQLPKPGFRTGRPQAGPNNGDPNRTLFQSHAQQGVRRPQQAAASVADRANRQQAGLADRANRQQAGLAARKQQWQRS